MINVTVDSLEYEEKVIERGEKQAVVFKSARLDKYFKNIDPRLRVDVAVFTNTVNITYWFAGTKTYFRSRYSREFDNQLGIILHSTYKNIKSLYSMGMFDNLLNETSVNSNLSGTVFQDYVGAADEDGNLINPNETIIKAS